MTAVPAPTPSDDADLAAVYERSNEAVTREWDVALPVVEGALPAALRGVLLRNGPGRLELYGQRYGHLFDGDGHVQRFAFDGQAIGYRNRWVRTREFLAEESARRILFRNFGTNIPGGLRKNFLRTRFKNAANTSLVHHAGRLLALWEGGWPHRLDPLTLATLGRDDLGGALRPPGRLQRWISPELAFSAHPRHDPASGALYNFGLVSAGLSSRLALYRVDRDGTCAPPAYVDLPGACFLHDFALTERRRVFFLTPAAFDLPRTLLGLSSPIETLRAQPGPTTVLVLGKDDLHVRRASARPCFLFHLPNAFDDGPRVVVDGLRMDDLPTAAATAEAMSGRATRFPRPILTRFTIDPERGTVDEEPLTDHPGELACINPAVAGRRHRFVWMIGAPPERRAPFHTAIVKVDCDRRHSTMREFFPNLTGEPVFVARPGATEEDDGWLLALLYVADAAVCHLLVLDARDLRTVCRARLPHSTPLGFHGIWLGDGPAS